MTMNGVEHRDEVIANLHAQVEAMRHLEYEAIERACEEALQGGVCGVLILRRGGTTLIGPHESVPYGTIMELIEPETVQ